MTFLPTGCANSFFIETAVGTFSRVATTILTETVTLLISAIGLLISTGVRIEL